MANLYVVVALNSMGPVIDPRHNDLLTSWEIVNQAFARACQDSYRLRYLDDFGQGIKFSLFCVSWSGFKSNPVQRDFGWHTIHDNYRKNFSREMDKWGDELYWMYNHPPASGVGNEWGLDWFQNAHYLNILNHFIIDRGYFPNAVQVPTERNDCSHFLEQWIPFDFGNRNSKTNNLNSINADGKLTGTVFDWSQAPHDWSHYQPSFESYQKKGDMKRTVFRIVDIRSIVHVLTEEEIERAFFRCLEGNDTVITAYEHDFRDRYETIMELMIEPIHKFKKQYKDVTIKYVNAAEGARAVLGRSKNSIKLGLSYYEDSLRVHSSKFLFGRGPYVCVYDLKSERYIQLSLTQIGENAWQFPEFSFENQAIIGIAAQDNAGNVVVQRWLVDPIKLTIELFSNNHPAFSKLENVK